MTRWNKQKLLVTVLVTLVAVHIRIQHSPLSWLLLKFHQNQTSLLGKKNYINVFFVSTYKVYATMTKVAIIYFEFSKYYNNDGYEPERTLGRCSKSDRSIGSLAFFWMFVGLITAWMTEEDCYSFTPLKIKRFFAKRCEMFRYTGLKGCVLSKAKSAFVGEPSNSKLFCSTLNHYPFLVNVLNG